MSITTLLGSLFGTNRGKPSLRINSQATTPKDYSNMLKTDRKKARALYHNTEPSYLLSGQLAKPVIKSNVNFVGKPTLKGNKRTVTMLNSINFRYDEVHKSAEIEGTIGVWPQWDMEKETIKIVLVPLDVINKVMIDPISKEIVGYKLLERITYNSETTDNLYVEITTLVTANKVERLVNGDMSEHTVALNPLGIVPITLFTTDKDPDELYGHSELESIEPQFRFYHDLTFEAGAAQSRDGHPKLKVKTNNPKQWVINNFGAGKYEEVLAGKSALTIDDRDLYLNAGEDDIAYLYLAKTSGDYEKLAKTTFTNMVEGSQVPEINFGANIGTSLASVKEYRPVWIKNIEAKQLERTSQWMSVYEICLTIYNFVHFTNLKPDIELVWPKPNFISALEQATVVKSFADALDKLMAKRTMTEEEAYNTLVALDVFKMKDSWKEHKEDIDAENKQKEDKEPDTGDKKTPDAGGTKKDVPDKSGDSSGDKES